MALPLQKQEKVFTYGNYILWDDQERWELIDGFAYNLAPAPLRKHQDISRELEMQIAYFLKDKPCKVYDAPFDVRLPEADEKDEDIKTVVQPDIVVVCDNKKLDEKGCKGAPDIVIEIISPATASKDMKTKFLLYEKHGVKEYWIVHPDDKTVMVFKLNEEKKYGRPDMYVSEDKLNTPILDGLEIDLNPVFQE